MSNNNSQNKYSVNEYKIKEKEFITYRQMARNTSTLSNIFSYRGPEEDPTKLAVSVYEAKANYLQDKYGFKDPPGALYARKDPTNLAKKAADPLSSIGEYIGENLPKYFEWTLDKGKQTLAGIKDFVKNSNLVTSYKKMKPPTQSELNSRNFANMKNATNSIPQNFQQYYDDLAKFKRLEPAKLDELKNPAIAGVANAASIADTSELLVTYPEPTVSVGSSGGWLAKLGSILSGAAKFISTGVDLASSTTKNKPIKIGVSNSNKGFIKWPKEIKPFHTGGVVLPNKKGGRNEIIAILQGGETVRTEAQEKELQDAKMKEFLAAYAPLVSGESDENDQYSLPSGNKKSKNSNTPVLANKTKYDEELIIATIADAWKTNRLGFRNILRYS